MMRWIVAGIMLASVSAAATPNVFDKPVKQIVVALPPDKDNPQAKPKRTCSYYAGFVEKEVDLGEIGADSQSVMSIAKGAKPPACNAKIAGETMIEAKNWQGYFKGAKGPFLFFDDGDGINGGLPFTVFSATTGKKLFEDSRQGDSYKSVSIVNGDLVLRYRRVFLAPCSLYADAKGCWKKIAAATALPESGRPDCTKTYKDEMARTPKYAADVANARSVVAYDAEAKFAAGKLDIKPLPGAATCWMED